MAKKIAAEMGVDLARLQGSGPAGRIVRDDVVAAAQIPSPEKPAAPQPPSIKPQPLIAASRGQKDTFVTEHAGKTIAARLLVSKTTIPHFYLQAQIDAEPMMSLRQLINPAAEAAGLGKLTVATILS